MLNVDVVDALLQLEKVMVAGNYANRSIIAYAREIRFFGEYYPDLTPRDWTENHVIYPVFWDRVDQQKLLLSNCIAFF